MPPWVPALDLVRPAAPNLTQIDPEPVGQFMAQSVQERRAGMSGKQRVNQGREE